MSAKKKGGEAKKRNPQDTTLRNLRAGRARIDALDARVRAIELYLGLPKAAARKR